MSSAADMGKHPPVTPEETVEKLPFLYESEALIAADAEPALRYLNKSNNTDLAEMLGLPSEGEN